MIRLQIMAGVVLGLATIVAVFWITFRRPPPLRTDDITTSIAADSDALSLPPDSHDGGHGGHF